MRNLARQKYWTNKEVLLWNLRMWTVSLLSEKSPQFPHSTLISLFMSLSYKQTLQFTFFFIVFFFFSFLIILILFQWNKVELECLEGAARSLVKHRRRSVKNDSKSGHLSAVMNVKSSNRLLAHFEMQWRWRTEKQSFRFLCVLL